MNHTYTFEEFTNADPNVLLKLLQEEENEEEDKDETPALPIILTRDAILKIESSLQASLLDPNMQEPVFFTCYVKPFILHSMIGTFRQWSATSSTNRFIHSSWFHQWGFRKAFIYAFETAFTRLPFQRITPHVDTDTLLPTLSITDTSYNGLPLNLFWSIDLQGYGAGYCGYRANTTSSAFYVLLLPLLLSQLLVDIKAQTRSWPWDKRRSQPANIELVDNCFTYYTEAFTGGILNFGKIQLHDTKSNFKAGKVRTQRSDSKQVLYLDGFRYYYTREIREQQPVIPRLLYEPPVIEVEPVLEETPPSAIAVELDSITPSPMLDTVEAAIRTHTGDTTGTNISSLQLAQNCILLGHRYDNLEERFNNLEREHIEQRRRIQELETLLKESRFTRTEFQAIPCLLNSPSDMAVSPLSNTTSPIV